MKEHADDSATIRRNRGRRHETRDISTRVVVVFGVSLVVGAILVHFVIWVAVRLLRERAGQGVSPPVPDGAGGRAGAAADAAAADAAARGSQEPPRRGAAPAGFVRLGGRRARRGPHPDRSRHGTAAAAGAPGAAQAAPAGTSPGMPERSSSGRTSARRELGHGVPGRWQSDDGRLDRAIAIDNRTASRNARSVRTEIPATLHRVVPGRRAAAAQYNGVPKSGMMTKGGMPGGITPAELKKVQFDQKLGVQVPLDLPFRDETGRAVQLSQYFNGRPVVLALVYYECPMLCTQALNGLVKSLKVLALEPGRDYNIVTVSFNPKETPAQAAEKKDHYLQLLEEARGGGGLALPDRGRAGHPAADRHGRLPLRLRRADEAVRPPDRDDRADARGQDVEVRLRDRLRPARPAPGAGGGVGPQGRHAGRSPAALLLSLRPGDREVRPGADERAAPRRRGDGGRASAASS